MVLRFLCRAISDQVRLEDGKRLPLPLTDKALPFLFQRGKISSVAPALRLIAPDPAAVHLAQRLLQGILKLRVELFAQVVVVAQQAFQRVRRTSFVWRTACGTSANRVLGNQILGKFFNVIGYQLPGVEPSPCALPSGCGLPVGKEILILHLCARSEKLGDASSLGVELAHERRPGGSTGAVDDCVDHRIEGDVS